LRYGKHLDAAYVNLNFFRLRMCGSCWLRDRSQRAPRVYLRRDSSDVRLLSGLLCLHAMSLGFLTSN
jgi:hypothetical protein